MKTTTGVTSDGTLYVSTTAQFGGDWIVTHVRDGKIVEHSVQATDTIDKLFEPTSSLLMPPPSHVDAVTEAMRATSPHYCAGHLVPDWLYKIVTRHLSTGVNGTKINAIVALRGYFGEIGADLSLKEAKQYVDALAANL